MAATERMWLLKEALNTIVCLPVLERLDREQTIGELNEALDSLATKNAPGKTAFLPKF